MLINCDQCPCLSENKCNLGYHFFPHDMGEGAFIPVSSDCKLVKIITKDNGEIFPKYID